MNRKILAFVYDGNKFLALRNNPEDLSHGGDFWFTITGSIKKGETEVEAIKREVKEETNLVVTEIFDLNWGSIYSWQNEDHQEKNYIALVDKGDIVLSKEHEGFEWLELEDFVNRIKWGLDKSELMAVLSKAIRKELFFKRPKFDDFRKK